MANDTPGTTDTETSIPSRFERVRETAAEEQTETPRDWTSPDEQRRTYRDRAFGSFTKLLDHDPATGLLTAEGERAFDRLVTAIKDGDGDKLDQLTRENEQPSTVTVTVTVVNSGASETTETFELVDDGDVVATESVTVEGGTEREVTFTSELQAPRREDLAVRNVPDDRVEIDIETSRQWISPRSANAGAMKGAHPATVGDELEVTDAANDEFRTGFEMSEPYSVESPEAAAELVEAYLFAVCRDVALQDYGTGERTDDASAFEAITGFDSITEWAAARLQATLDDVADAAEYPDAEAVAAALDVPTDSNGVVTPETLFRGYSHGESLDDPDDTVGPYHSQFLMQRLYPLFPSGCAPYVAGLTGVTELDLDDIALERHVPIANRREFGVTFEDYVDIQNGDLPREYREDDFEDDRGRYPYTGRDLGTHVHTDGPYQEYYRATSVLLFWDFPRTQVSPYGRTDSPNEADGVTFGPVDPFATVGAVAYEAFKAAWVQKWRSFIRLRPEAMAGLVELERNRSSPLSTSTVHDVLEDTAADDVVSVVEEYNERQAEYGFVDADENPGTALLGQMYPEGSPTHPAYPSGHATTAGACVTVLKALFDDQAPITETGMRPVDIDPEDPTSHVFIDRGEHADPAIEEMTVGTELDKLASNISHARMFGGVHFRSDGERGMRLGEKVAIEFLQDHLREYPEDDFDGAFEFTDRDGRRLRITPDGVERID